MLRKTLGLICFLALIGAAANAAPTTPELSTRFMQAYKGNLKVLYPAFVKELDTTISKETTPKQRENLINGLEMQLAFAATSLAANPYADMSNYPVCLQGVLKRETPAGCDMTIKVVESALQANSLNPVPEAYTQYTTAYIDILANLVRISRKADADLTTTELAHAAAYVAFRWVNEKTAAELNDIHECLYNSNAHTNCNGIANRADNEHYFKDLVTYAAKVN